MVKAKPDERSKLNAERIAGNTLVSVIMPVYNIPGDLLERASRSALMQSYRDIELLMVDDGSNCICAGKCDEIALSDDRVSVIHQEHAGVSAARNVALDCAKGEWVAFVDGDDELLPGAIERGVAIGEEFSLDIVYGEITEEELLGKVVYVFRRRGI